MLILCGVFAKENEQEVISNAKRTVEFSANIFQKKLINGFCEIGADFEVISAPFIGSYPNASKMRKFQGFSNEQTEYTYVPFNNLWGIRNFSRATALKAKLNTFIQEECNEKLIVIYSPHTPFLDAAVFAKKQDARIRICMVVPDLPQYMNLNEHVSWIYRIGKKCDIARFNYLNTYVDSYVLLTEAMKEPLRVGLKPYLVVEGLVDSERLHMKLPKKEIRKETYIVYTGKMNRKFGVCDLVDAFADMVDPNYRLILCGSGDAEDYIQACAQKDKRIICFGQVAPDVAQEWIMKADVLVNPRPNNEEYTKYSFPSKNIEYLLSGNPVVAYMLDGMPTIYEKCFFVAEEDMKTGLGEAIIKALMAREEQKKYKFIVAYKHFRLLVGKEVASKLIEMNSTNSKD